MNRPGQPPSRQPTLSQTPGIAAQYRQQYPNYGLPQRGMNVLQAGYNPVGGLQPNSHRTSSQQPIPSPYLQQQQQQPQRLPSYPFGTSMPQTIPSQNGQQQQQSHANGTSQAAEVALDPSDFPALGAPSVHTSNAPGSSSTPSISYATQAGTGVPLSAGSGVGNANSQQRDFTADDFPALGGQTQTQEQNQDTQQQHPPGLNGFESSQPQRLLGSLNGTIHQAPGMLTLPSSQARGNYAQSEADKQRANFNQKMAASTSHTWTPPPGSTLSAASGPNGVAPTPVHNAGLPSHPPGVPVHPPGVPPPSASFTQPPLSSATATAGASTPASQSIPNSQSLPNGTSHDPSQQHPETPAQQVLVSAADRWGLLALITMVKNAIDDPDQGLSSVGTDLSLLNLDMSSVASLYSTFVTPFTDMASTAVNVESEYHIPACYNVNAPPPGPTKAQAFSEETLFFMFYAHPQDALQEVAAQELFNRSWRYHKELRCWITKDGSQKVTQQVPGGEAGSYVIWDAENWTKQRRDMTVLYAELEDVKVPVFAPAPTLQLATKLPAHQASVHPQAQQQQPHIAHTHLPQTQRTYPTAVGML